MKTRLPIGLIALFCLIPCQQLSAADTAPESLLPADTAIFPRLSSWTELREAARATAVGEVMRGDYHDGERLRWAAQFWPLDSGGSAGRPGPGCAAAARDSSRSKFDRIHIISRVVSRLLSMPLSSSSGEYHFLRPQ